MEIKLDDFVMKVELINPKLGQETHEILDQVIRKGCPKKPSYGIFDLFKARFLGKWRLIDASDKYSVSFERTQSYVGAKVTGHIECLNRPVYTTKSGFKTYTIEDKNVKVYFDLLWDGIVKYITCIGKKTYGTNYTIPFRTDLLELTVETIAEDNGVKYKKSRFFTPSSANDSEFEKGIKGVYKAQETLDTIIENAHQEGSKQARILIKSVE